MDRDQLFKGIDILEGLAELYVINDGIEAVIKPESNTISDELIEQIPGVLDEAGIVFGVLSRPELKPDGSYSVAKGMEPVAGKDGRIELEVAVKGHEEEFSDELKQKTAERETASDTHDMRELNLLTNVKKGDVIARKISPARGVNGKNVFGEEIPAEGGKWVAFNPGAGVEIVHHDMTLVASLSGKVDISPEGRMSVLEEWLIDGSVDASTGHVEFWGKSLVITGSVIGGYRVRVTGDLEVGGNIEDETDVRTGGNLTVNGIIRAGLTNVSVGGNLECNSIEYASVRVTGNLVCNNYILDAKVDVQGDVMVTGGKGLVAGGRLRSGRNVQAGKLGTQANVITEVRAGYDPVLIDIEEKLHEEIGALFRKKQQLREGLEKLIKLEKERGPTEKSSAIKDEILSAVKAIKIKVDEKRDELASVEARLDSIETSTVKVFGVTYPNVMIFIGNAELKVSTEVSGADFSFRKGQVVVVTS